MSFFPKCFLTTAEFEGASLPPIARIPSDVKNHLYLSYQFFFLISANETESFSVSALFCNFANFFCVLILICSIDFIAPDFRFASLNNIDAIDCSEDCEFIFIFSSSTMISVIPFSLVNLEL